MTRARTRVASLALAVLVSPPAPALAQSTAQPPSNAAGAAGERVGSDAQAAPIPRSGTAPAEAPRTLAQLLRSARAWIEAGEADRAWRALEDRLDDYAGDPGFDYLLGLAALDSGRPGRAVLALERVLIVRPDFLQARAELARAYFRLREHENARREFETVAARSIPEEARRVIGRYLDAIRRLERAGEPEFVAWAELDAGYDSNANFGSASGHWVLADGTEVVPLGISRPRESAAFGAAIGADWTVPIGGPWQWTVGGRAATRRYPSAHTLDQDQFDLNTGFTHRSGCHRIDMLVQAQHLELGGAGFRDAVGALVQWQCDVDARTRVGAYAQRFEFDFPHEPARDARRSGGGLTLARVLEGAARPVLVAGVSGGRERSLRGFGNLSYDYRGLRAAYSRALGNGWRGFVSLSHERRDFDAIESFFGVVREDRQTDLRIGAERALSRKWTVAPAITYTRSRSTVAPNDFRRTQANILLRYRLR
ncbi:MAG TPA: tetratricopeptide repeat protein [Zeimonas sp.]|nr:tetratricopeptide repeat protein [Zeimonas sp.]